MKTRLFSTLAVALVVVFSLAIAGEKGGKSAKTASTKKVTKSCCAGEAKSASACTDKEMKECEAKEAKTSTKATESKATGTEVETKSEVKKD